MNASALRNGSAGLQASRLDLKLGEHLLEDTAKGHESGCSVHLLKAFTSPTPCICIGGSSSTAAILSHNSGHTFHFSPTQSAYDQE